MWKAIVAILGGLIIFEGGGGGGGGSAVTASCTPDVWYSSGTTAPAPTLVQFNCDATTHSDAGVRPKSDLIYDYSYGDAGCTDWTTGFGQFDCNGDTWHSPTAAHLYRSAGTYSWTVTVTDPNGQTDSESGSITIVDPNTVWAIGDRRCICYDGAGAGCQTSGVAGFAGSVCDTDGDGDCTGAGETAANCIEAEDLDATLDETDGRWWNIRCGDDYTISTAMIGGSATNTVGRMVSGYGTCAIDDAINITHTITYPGSGIIDDGATPVSNLRMMNINATYTGAGNGAGALVGCNGTSDCELLTFVDNRVNNIRTLFGFADSSDTHERVAFVGNEFNGVVNSTDPSGFYSISRVKRFVWLGNNFNLSASGTGAFASNGLRVPAHWYYIAAHNSLVFPTAGGSAGRATWQMRGGNGDIDTEIGIIARNRYWDDTDEPFRMFTVCTSQACGTADSPNLHQHLVFEGNYLGTGGSHTRHWQPWIINNQDVSIINNVIDARGLSTTNSNTTAVATNPNDLAPERLVVFGNTILDDFAQGASVIDICSDATSTGRCRNNLVWSENKTSGTNLTRSYNGTASNNVALYGSSQNVFYGVSDNADLTGACDNGQTAQAYTCFKQRTTLPAGANPQSVRGGGFDFPGAEDFFDGLDFEGQTRPRNSDGWDIGADEF